MYLEILILVRCLALHSKILILDAPAPRPPPPTIEASQEKFH